MNTLPLSTVTVKVQRGAHKSSSRSTGLATTEHWTTVTIAIKSRRTSLQAIGVSAQEPARQLVFPAHPAKTPIMSRDADNDRISRKRNRWGTCPFVRNTAGHRSHERPNFFLDESLTNDKGFHANYVHAAGIVGHQTGRVCDTCGGFNRDLRC